MEARNQVSHSFLTLAEHLPPAASRPAASGCLRFRRRPRCRRLTLPPPHLSTIPPPPSPPCVAAAAAAAADAAAAAAVAPSAAAAAAAWCRRCQLAPQRRPALPNVSAVDVLFSASSSSSSSFSLFSFCCYCCCCLSDPLPQPRGRRPSGLSRRHLPPAASRPAASGCLRFCRRRLLLLGSENFAQVIVGVLEAECFERIHMRRMPVRGIETSNMPSIPLWLASPHTLTLNVAFVS